MKLQKALVSWIPSHEAMLLRHAIKEGKDITLLHSMVRFPRVILDNMNGMESKTWDLTKIKFEP